MMSEIWESEQVFLDGDEYFTRLFSDLQRAKFEITVEMYIFNDDALGLKFTEALIEAHKRGVKVQLIVDGVGSYTFYSHLFAKFQAADIRIKMYNPLPFIHPYFGNLTFWQKWSALFTRLLRLNQRDHRKIITIDQKILFTGSYNITAEHTAHAGQLTWKDAGVRLEGDLVKQAVLSFKRLWSLKEYYQFRKSVRPRINWKTSPLKINSSLISRRYFYKEFIGRIKKAEKTIWLTTPYFIPKRKLIRALGKAAKRGIDVQLLTTAKSDVELFRTLQFFYYPYLLKKGVKVYQYRDTILHGKIYIVDDWVSVGSTNLNHRSLMHDLEADVVIQKPENVELLKADFVKSTHSQLAITLEGLSNRMIWDRFLSQLFYLFKYWF